MQFERPIQKDPTRSAPKPSEVEQQPEPTVQDPMTRLHQMVGNRAVSQMVQKKSSALPPMIQAKMAVSPANDPYEVEADNVAKQVVGMSDVQRQDMPEEELAMKRIQREAIPEEEELAMKRIQREAIPEEEELAMKRIQREAIPEEEELAMKRIQREAIPEEDELMTKSEAEMVPEVTPDIESSIEQNRGGGQSMSDDSLNFFESRFGADFENVNIHTGTEADKLNRQLDARAFTTGSDIFFRSGEYNPETPGGKELLAHELTHVVQQNAAPQRKPEDQD